MSLFGNGRDRVAAGRVRFGIHRLFTDNSGVVILITALVAPVVIGFVALGVETALWYTQRNSLQAAADAAAIAGAYELRRGKDTNSIITIAREEAKRNGYAFTPESNAINVPPESGNYTDDAAVEAILNATIELLFSTNFVEGLGQIEARAVALVTEGSEACILALDPDASDSGRVEEGRGGLYRIGITPFPFPAHQTGRANFPHPAFRLASSRGTRRGAKMNPAQPKHAEIPEHGPSREPRGAARRHLVTPDQKMPHALIDVRKSGSAFALR